MLASHLWPYRVHQPRPCLGSNRCGKHMLNRVKSRPLRSTAQLAKTSMRAWMPRVLSTYRRLRCRTKDGICRVSESTWNLMAARAASHALSCPPSHSNDYTPRCWLLPTTTRLSPRQPAPSVRIATVHWANIPLRVIFPALQTTFTLPTQSCTRIRSTCSHHAHQSAPPSHSSSPMPRGRSPSCTKISARASAQIKACTSCMT
ncbi:hypothetical protein BKA80DRAFT_258906 [Phyllosticta citrichinensis]